ncbi:hypothetical protein [Sphingomonas sp. GC_Shp_4]|nr:hypothetical protein [Sphingomonas sp. GC_Shp_4]
MTRSEKVAALAARLVAAGHLQRRVRETLGVIEAEVRSLHAELAATLAQGDPIAEYQRQFIRRLEAEGIGQPDLHPVSGELAKVVATAIRAYRTTKGNSGRRGSDDYPLNAWHELPRTFAGIQLEDVARDDVIDSTPCPLPPSPNSAHYTNGKVPLEPLSTRRETLLAWSPSIKAWCKKHSVHLTGMQVAAWAMLLAHRLRNDASDLKSLNGLEMASPWDPNGFVRFVVLPPPAEQDA